MFGIPRRADGGVPERIGKYQIRKELGRGFINLVPVKEVGEEATQLVGEAVGEIAAAVFVFN